MRALSAQGVEASFYSSDVKRTRYRDRWLQRLAKERGVREAALDGVMLRKHISPLRAFRDVRRLSAHLRAAPPDLIHCHLPGDHFIAARAVGRSGLALPIVRTLYDGEPPPLSRRTRRTLRRCVRLVCLSRAVADRLRERAVEIGLAAERVVDLAPPIDVHRFDPDAGIRPRRDALGVPADAFCVGIVARMQTHRLFEVLLEAILRARKEVPNLHLVVVGRGTNQESVAREPVRQMGLESNVHFSGYVSGEEYVGTLASFDAKVFLVPGSDGTCRAVREALALGLPVITTRRGILPQLVRDDVDGILVDAEPAALALAVVGLAKDPERRERMARAAREGALERFPFEVFARKLVELYEEVKSG